MNKTWIRTSNSTPSPSFGCTHIRPTKNATVLVVKTRPKWTIGRRYWRLLQVQNGMKEAKSLHKKHWWVFVYNLLLPLWSTACTHWQWYKALQKEWQNLAYLRPIWARASLPVCPASLWRLDCLPAEDQHLCTNTSCGYGYSGPAVRIWLATAVENTIYALHSPCQDSCPAKRVWGSRACSQNHTNESSMPEKSVWRRKIKQNILNFLIEDSHKPDVFVPVTVKQKLVPTATEKLYFFQNNRLAPSASLNHYGQAKQSVYGWQREQSQPSCHFWPTESFIPY